MNLSSAPEKSGAEPCLRCSSVAVLTRPSIVFTWQNLRILAQKGQALWGILGLEFEKSNFQGKSLQRDNETRQKPCCLEKQLWEWESFPQTKQAPWGTSTACNETCCKDPRAGHWANVRARSRTTVSVSCLLRGQFAMISPSFRRCAVLSLQVSLGFALEFWQRQYKAHWHIPSPRE